MRTWKLSASNIGWAKEDDTLIYNAMQTLGYDGLEIAPTRVFDAPPYAHTAKAPAFASEVYAKHGFVIPSMQSILFGVSENLFDEQGAKILLERLNEAFIFAKACSCKSLVFGCPRNRTFPENMSEKDGDYFFIKAAKLAENQGVTLALETVPTCYNTNFLNNTADTLAFVKRLNVKGLSVNLDIGAMITNGESIDVIKDDFTLISHIHISEKELAPIVPHALHKELAELLAQKQYSGFVSAEMRTTTADVMQKSLEYMAEVFA